MRPPENPHRNNTPPEDHARRSRHILAISHNIVRSRVRHYAGGNTATEAAMKTVLTILLLAFAALGTATAAELRDARLRDDCSTDIRRISIKAWPHTDFSRCTVDIAEILAG